MYLENGVNGIGRRRWYCKCATERAHLASKPIKLQPSTVFEIVCHRSFPAWLHTIGDEVHALVDKVGIQGDAYSFADRKRFLHQCAEKIAQLGVGHDWTNGRAQSSGRACEGRK